MPKPSSPLERCNAVLRAFDTPFRLRQHRRSQWVTVYEILPGRCTKERSIRGYPAAEATALERLCDRLLEASKQGLALDAVVEPEVNGKRPGTGSPCWPEICQAVVAFQRGQGVNMNLVGPCSRGRATSACCPTTGRRALRRCAALPSMRISASGPHPSDPLHLLVLPKDLQGNL